VVPIRGRESNGAYLRPSGKLENLSVAESYILQKLFIKDSNTYKTIIGYQFGVVI